MRDVDDPELDIIMLSPDAVRAETLIVDAELDSGLVGATKAHIH